jgi:membrane dipeptidase
LVGVQHLAIGTDLDGWLPAIPYDMRDCCDTVKILDGLRSRGWSEQDVSAVAGENALRLLSQPRS